MRMASAALQRYLLKVTWIDLYTCQQFRRESVCACMCQNPLLYIWYVDQLEDCWNPLLKIYFYNCYCRYIATAKKKSLYSVVV